MAECACCGADVNEAVHAYMDALEAAYVSVAGQLKAKHGTTPDATDCLAALVSLTARVIDSVYKGERRARELQKCEQFFRDEHAN